jgi:hypothetical protein
MRHGRNQEKLKKNTKRAVETDQKEFSFKVQGVNNQALSSHGSTAFNLYSPATLLDR